MNNLRVCSGFARSVKFVSNNCNHTGFGKCHQLSSKSQPLFPRVPSRTYFSPGPNVTFTRAPFGRRVLLLCTPLAAGGLALWLADKEESTSLAHLLHSPTIIPCLHEDGGRLSEHLCRRQTHHISSPNEERVSLISKIFALFRDRIWEPIRTGGRFLHLAFLFGPVLLTSPMLFIGAKTSKAKGERWGAVWWYGFLVAQMQRAGPTFIKLAQWAGSRQDLFPGVLCDKLGRLHSNGKPHSIKFTKRVIERVFARPFDEVFEHFEEEPIGTGAIAQVYKAILNPHLLPNNYLDPPKYQRSPSGSIAEGPRAALAEYAGVEDAHPTIVPTSSVAIKVLHPGVKPMIRRDVAIMTFFADCLSVIPGIEWLSLREEVDVFGKMMFEQIDLTHEARNLRTFEQNFNGRRSAVTFPRPLEDFSSTDVLIEEFQNAVPLKHFLRNGGGSFDHRLANLGLDAFLNMLLLDNFTHADLHPGNILVKFYKPTTKFVYQNILSKIFHTTPPSTDISSISDLEKSKSDETSLEQSPSEQSDVLVNRLRPLAHDQDKFLEELEKIADEGYQPSLVFIDAGLVTTLSRRNRRNFLELFRAIAEFDGYRAGSLMVERSSAPQLVIDKETFALKIQHLVLGVKSKTFKLGAISISDVLTQLLSNVRIHHVKMEGDFVNTVLAMLLLEGIGRRLDPDMDLIKSALPILRRVGSSMTASDAADQGLIPGKDGGSWENLWAMAKVYFYMEARELVSTAVVNIDDMIKYDWLSTNV